jgi:hypothetical protein
MKSAISTAIFAVTLVLTGSAAMAGPSPADPIPNGAQVSYAHPAGFAALSKVQPRAQLNGDIAQFVQRMLNGGPVPYANLIRDVRNMPVSRGNSDSSYSPIYDSPAATAAGCAACDAQAASDQEVQEIQQMNDTMALTASMAAAEEENDEANAATLQTEINAGM